MRTLYVTPNEGIGSLKLGMSPEQILNAIKKELSFLEETDKNAIQISEDKEEDGFSLRYIKDSFFFMVRYRNDKAVEISVDRELSGRMNIILYDIDVFRTQAEQIVDILKKFSKCSYDMEDEQLSTNYEFYDIGIRLWREEPFHTKLLLDKDYMEKMRLVIDEMYRYLYFDIITVKQNLLKEN